MNFLTGLKNLFEFINNNWAMISTIIVLGMAIAKKACAFFSKSQEEQVAIAKAQIKEIMLRLVTDAEEDYSQWVKSGAIKRSQVIEEIFVMYPVLSKVVNQEEIIAWIDDAIDEALKTMRKIFEENKAAKSA